MTVEKMMHARSPKMSMAPSTRWVTQNLETNAIVVGHGSIYRPYYVHEGLRLGDYNSGILVYSPQCIQYRAELKKLSLSNDAVWEREEKRPEIEAPVVIKVTHHCL
eukprot:725786-Amorphochlora_amoeboformis.AAC.1